MEMVSNKLYFNAKFIAQRQALKSSLSINSFSTNPTKFLIEGKCAYLASPIMQSSQLPNARCKKLVAQRLMDLRHSGDHVH